MDSELSGSNEVSPGASSLEHELEAVKRSLEKDETYARIANEVHTEMTDVMASVGLELFRPTDFDNEGRLRAVAFYRLIEQDNILYETLDYVVRLRMMHLQGDEVTDEQLRDQKWRYIAKQVVTGEIEVGSAWFAFFNEYIPGEQFEADSDEGIATLANAVDKYVADEPLRKLRDQFSVLLIDMLGEYNIRMSAPNAIATDDDTLIRQLGFALLQGGTQHYTAEMNIDRNIAGRGLPAVLAVDLKILMYRFHEELDALKQK